MIQVFLCKADSLSIVALSTSSESLDKESALK